MRSLWLLVTVAAMAGCADNREAETDACSTEAMRSNVSSQATYVRLCMSAKGYAFRVDDQLCMSSYGGSLVLWNCFRKRPTVRIGP